MKLIFLYGPPAVGKLTVAEELTKITGYKVFHNHLTVDLLEPLFGWGTKKFSEFLTKYRLELLEAVAEENVDHFIFTYVYTGSVYDRFFIESVKEVMEKHRGNIFFVQLTCTKEELLKRVKHSSRKRYNKIKTMRMLKDLLKRRDVYATMPSDTNFTIDNTKLSPKKAALLIQKHWRL